MNQLELIGLLTVSYFLAYKPIVWLLKWLTNYFTNSSDKLLRPVNGEYAIVTGATDGIGLEYAKQLADRGYNLLLISRTESKLKNVVERLKCQKRSVNVEYMVVDFSHQDIYGEIEERLKQLNGPIHVLVNNVGMMFNIPEYFIKYPKDFNLKLINTNIVSITMMCQIVMPIMMEQKRRIKTNDRGIIINIGSAAGLTEFPFFSTYSASKAYITYFSKILSYEYEQDGIIIQTVTPNQVDTKLAANVQVPNLSTTPQSFVSYALKTVANERFTNGHPKHKLINNLSKFIGDLLGNHLYMNFKFRIIQNEMNLIKNANRKTKLISIDDDKIFD